MEGPEKNSYKEFDKEKKFQIILVFWATPRSSSLPSSMLGELDREVELDYWWSTVDEDRARVDIELGIKISSTVYRDRLSIELDWHVELDGSVSSSVAQKTNMIQNSCGSKIPLLPP